MGKIIGLVFEEPKKGKGEKKPEASGGKKEDA